jgi:hypothetical protein
MSAPSKITSTLVAGVLAGAVALLVVPSIASADVPSYATAEQTIRGRIASINGAYNITVNDDSGYQDSIQLHHGTIINPTGLTLEGGMSVTIIGYNAGSVFEANEIDTPYNYDGPRPAPVYYGPGWWYPGFAYGYGPSYSLVIVGGHPIYRSFYRVRYVGPAPEPRAYVGFRYVGHPHPSRPPHGGYR